MFELLAYFLEPILWMIFSVYKTDDRPEARRITIGCGLVALAFTAFIVFLAVMQRAK